MLSLLDGKVVTVHRSTLPSPSGIAVADAEPAGGPQTDAIPENSILLIEQRRTDELQLALGTVRLAALLGLLAAECRDRPALMRAGHDRGDLAGVSAAACSLKGAAISIGAAALGEAAGRLAGAQDLITAAELIEALDDAARATLCAVQGLLGYSPRLYAVA